MSSIRTAALALGALAALAAPAAPGAGLRGASSGARRRAVGRPPGVGPAGGARPADDRPAGAGADRLEAARTVALYCRLVDQGQFARAGDLCARRRLWSRHALAGITRFHFRSARVFAAPDARTLVLAAHVRVRTGRGCPLPDGLAVLFFTLGRVGNAAGGWLITAVTASP